MFGIGIAFIIGFIIWALSCAIFRGTATHHSTRKK